MWQIEHTNDRDRMKCVYLAMFVAKHFSKGMKDIFFLVLKYARN